MLYIACFDTCTDSTTHSKKNKILLHGWIPKAHLQLILLDSTWKAFVRSTENSSLIKELLRPWHRYTHLYSVSLITMLILLWRNGVIISHVRHHAYAMYWFMTYYKWWIKVGTIICKSFSKLYNNIATSELINTTWNYNSVSKYNEYITHVGLVMISMHNIHVIYIYKHWIKFQYSIHYLKCHYKRKTACMAQI